MTRRPHAFRLNLESLEGRTLLSSAAPGRESRQARLEALLDATDRAGKLAPAVRTLAVSTPAKHGEAATSAKAAPKMKATGQFRDATAIDDTTVLVRFRQNVKKVTLDPSQYRIEGIQVVSVRRGVSWSSVVLTTTTQGSGVYTLKLVRTGASTARPGAGLIRAFAATPLVSGTALGTVTFVGRGAATAINPPTAPYDLPRVVGAVSLDNTHVLVQFNRPMNESVLDAARYAITQVNVTPEAGRLIVLKSEFAPNPNTATKTDRAVVILTTESQNELAYEVAVTYALDANNNPIGPRQASGGLVLDPSHAGFRGTPPVAGSTLRDTDGDGLTDNEERRGWTVVFKPANGVPVTRQVTSDPNNPDTDGDKFPDNVEAQLRLDPRDADTDDDLLTDWQEYNEIYSDNLNGDTDGDGVDDGTEYLSIKSDPLHSDTDGDQIPDGEEISSGGYRNVRVAALPEPGIVVGNVDLRLDVRFTETTATGSRDLQTKSVSSTLTQSDRRESSTTDVGTFETYSKFGTEISASYGVTGAFIPVPTISASIKVYGESGVSGSYSTSSTKASAQESQRAYEDSLTTDAETTRNAEVQRVVAGASIKVALSLTSNDTLAYQLKNLVVTAFIQDPQDPTSLTPVATLRPDFEPEDGFALGPLVASRGPLILSSESIYPSLVESLMANPRGLVFQISNYDILDERGRNFAFTSSEIAARTGSVVFDYGVEDTDGDGESDGQEAFRVATFSGRAVQDTNGDGKIDDRDHRVTFDPRSPSGFQVGITVGDALGAVGLDHYYVKLDGKGAPVLGANGLPLDHTLEHDKVTDAVRLVPVATPLSRTQWHQSYATYFDINGVERIFRVRETYNQTSLRKQWMFIKVSGEIDDKTGFSDLVLKAGGVVKLAYVQDLDGDNLPAALENLLGTVDSDADVYTDSLGRSNGGEVSLDLGTRYSNPLTGQWTRIPDKRADSWDTDGDGLGDRLEALVGWTVDLGGKGSRRVFSSGYLADTDHDGLSDTFEAPDFDRFVDQDTPKDLRVDVALPPASDSDKVTDPTSTDTDGDGVVRYVHWDIAWGPKPSDDYLEVHGDGQGAAGTYLVDRIYTGGGAIRTSSQPDRVDTDGDGLADGTEVRFGLDPKKAGDKDSDRDGLPDAVELAGWLADYRAVSTTARTDGLLLDGVSGSPAAPVPESKRRIKSDPYNPDSDGDGLDDFQEYNLKTNPLLADSDRDGLTDAQEYLGVIVRDLNVITLNPLDADGDNDMLSDGAEADLNGTAANRWIVAADGATPYQVFTDPRVDDADFDGLVDGEEFNFNAAQQVRSDPHKSDTDGDGRSDRTERIGGLNPLVADYLVTVYFVGLTLTDVNDPYDAAEIYFGLGVRKPDEGAPFGLSAAWTGAVIQGDSVAGPKQTVDVPRSDYDASNLTDDLRVGDLGYDAKDDPNVNDHVPYWSRDFGLEFQEGDTLDLGRFAKPGKTPSISFAVAKNQRFSIEGVIEEFDGYSDNEQSSHRTQFFLGGVAGIAASAQPPPKDGEVPAGTIRTVFTGADLAAAAIQDLYFAFDSDDDADVTLTGPKGGRIAGWLHALYVVS